MIDHEYHLMPTQRTKVLGFALVGALATLFLLSTPTIGAARHYAYPTPDSASSFQQPRPRLILEPTPSIPYPDRVELQTSLLATLRTILQRPIPSYTDSLAEQQKYCPTLLTQTAPHQIKSDYKGWQAFTTGELEDARADVVWSLAEDMGMIIADPPTETSRVNSARFQNSFGISGRGKASLLMK